MYRRFFLFIIIAFICSGCSAIGRMANEPRWVSCPSAFEKDGYVYGVGLSPRFEDLFQASRAAEISARTQILRFLEVEPTLRRGDIKVDWSSLEISKSWRDGEREVTYAMVRYKIPEK